MVGWAWLGWALVLAPGKQKNQGGSHSLPPHPPQLFFTGLAIATSGARSRGDTIDVHVQHGGWGAKLAAWVVLTLGAFFVPVGALPVYEVLARAASILFLCVQLLLLLDFVCDLNDAAVDAGDDRALWGLLAASGASLGGAVAFTAVSFHFFNPSSAPNGCAFNIAAILAAPLAGAAVTVLALSPAAPRGSLFPSAVVTLYASYLTYSALVSEPHTYACNALGAKLDAASGGAMAAAVLLAAASVVYAALRAGSSSSLLSLAGGADDDTASLDGYTPLTDRDLTSAGLDGVAGARVLPPDDVAADAPPTGAALAPRPPPRPLSYSYPFFHAVLAAASGYVAMLLTGWGTGAAERRLIDVGWPSVAVKLTYAWAALALYAWTLVAPRLMPDRFDF